MSHLLPGQAGFRLVVVCAALTIPLGGLATALAQRQLTSRTISRYGFIGNFNAQASFTLLGNEGVQKDLELSAEQKSRVAGLARQTLQKLDAERTELQGKLAAKEISQAEYMSQMPAAIQRVVNEARPEFAKLVTKEQNDRLLEIQWQLRGIEDETLLKSLNLSAEQLEKLKQIETDWREKQNAILADLSAADRFERMDQANAEKQQARAALLTDEQRSQMAKAKGKEFDLSSLRAGFGPFDVTPPSGRGPVERAAPVRYPLPASPLALLRLAGVQEELKMSAEQVAAVEKLKQEMNEASLTAFRSAQFDAEMQKLEPTQRYEAIGKRLADEYYPKFEAILKAEQSPRYQQLYWQKFGLDAPSLRFQLEMTPEQRAEFDRINAQTRSRLERELAGASIIERSTKLTSISEEARQAKLKLLNAAQLEKLRELEGEAFDFKEASR